LLIESLKFRNIITEKSCFHYKTDFIIGQNQWTFGEQIPIAVYGHNLVETARGSVLMLGGYTPFGIFFNQTTVFLYEILMIQDWEIRFGNINKFYETF